jgi:hypothetical protein
LGINTATESRQQQQQQQQWFGVEMERLIASWMMGV